MSRYLLEIGLEEVPARFMPGLLDQLKRGFESTLTQSRLSFEVVRVWGTYRRLVVIVDGLAARQEDRVKKVLGPSADIAIGADGAHLPPAIGFAKKQGVSPELLHVVTENGKRVLCIEIEEIGQTAGLSLPGIIQTVLGGLNLPIAMKWGDATETFIRPVHWILSLLDNQIIPFSLYGCEAGRKTWGHRLLTHNQDPATFASGQCVEITDVASYEAVLDSICVQVDPDKRRTAIKTALEKHLESDKIDADLVEEVIYLVEWPTPLIGEFEPMYLELPAEVLIQCMKKNQKFFPMWNGENLASQFLFIADNVTPQNRDVIIAGNQQVLKARLEDARFFWEEDRKLTLDELAEKLKAVVFQKNAGTIYDKKERIKVLCDYFSDAYMLGAFFDLIVRTADLCKADLVSQMVYELPVLQGTMGMIYAQLQGEEELVSKGIYEHYLPRFAQDRLPDSPTGLVVGLSDRIDTLVCCFANGLIPTGSQDPWATRRLSNAVIQLIFSGNTPLNLIKILDVAYPLVSPESKNRDKLEAFLEQRFKQYLLDQDLPFDVVDAILDKSLADPLRTRATAKAVQEYRISNPDDLKLMAETAVRTKRLGEKSSDIAVNLSRFTEEIETQTWALFVEVERQTQQDFWSRQFSAGINRLSELSGPLALYFEKILVMCDDQDVRQNRLAFLRRVDTLYRSALEFEKIVI